MRLHIIVLSLLILGFGGLAPAPAQAGLVDYLRDNAAEYLQKQLKKKGYDLQWRGLDHKNERLGFLDHRWTFTFEEICLAVLPQLEKLCFTDSTIAFRWKLLQPKLVSIVELGPITLQHGVAVIDLSTEPTEPAKIDKNTDKEINFNLPEVRLPKMMRDARFNPVAITIDQLSVRTVQGKKPSNGKLTVTVDSDRSRLARLQFKASIPDFNGDTAVQASGEATSHSFFTKGDYSLTAEASIQSTESKTKTQVKLSAQQVAPGQDSQAKLTLTSTIQEKRLQANVDATLARKQVAIVISGSYDPGVQNAPQVQVKAAHLKLVPKNMTFTIPFALRQLPTDRRIISKTVDAVFEGNIQHSHFIPDINDTWRGNYKTRFQAADGSAVQAKLQFNGKFSGIPKQWDKQFNVTGDLDADFAVASFAELNKLLLATPFAVPAPLNSLDGPMRLKVAGHLDTKSKTQLLPITLDVNLAAGEQALKLHTEGSNTMRFVNLRPASMSLKATTQLDTVKLRLPGLDPTSMPRLVNDSRVILESEAPEQASKIAFNYDLEFVTLRSDSIQLLSRFAEEPVEIALNVTLQDKKSPTGKVSIDKTKLEFFRRDAQIEFLKLALKDPIEKSAVDGKITVNYVDYIVTIQLSGTVGRPRVILQSEPPLPQDQVIALLIYGEPMENLNSSDVASVGAMNAAIADRALALGSLYLFASTPIQQINYDSQSEVVSARIKLAKGTSFIVGTNTGQQQQQAGFRQSLGKGWYLTTLIETATKETATALSALIEWFKRF